LDVELFNCKTVFLAWISGLKTIKISTQTGDTSIPPSHQMNQVPAATISVKNPANFL